MSNIVYQDIVYNESYKEYFLNRCYINESSRNPLRRIFAHVYQYEDKWGKDLYDFSEDELCTILHSLNPLTFIASYSNGRYVSSYIEFSMWQGHRNELLNPLYNKRKQWYKQFVSPENKTYWTDQEIMDIENFCINDQDKAVIRCLFEGVNGRKESAEIMNLKKQDIQGNVLTLTDYDQSTRTLEVSDRCIQFLKAASIQTKFFQQNGKAKKAGQNQKPTNELIQNEYIIRSAKTKTLNTEKAAAHRIYQRFDVIKKQMNFPNFTSKNITKSGVVFRAKQLLERDGKLGRDQYKEVARQFNYNPDQWVQTVKEIAPEDLVRSMYEINEGNQNDFIPLDDGLTKQIREIEIGQRIGQQDFRDIVLEAYDFQCAITRETCLHVIQAAHIQSYIDERSNHVQNGLPLRMDVHRLFDLGLITITPDYHIQVSSQIESDAYKLYHNKKLHLPIDQIYYPSVEALAWQRKKFKP